MMAINPKDHPYGTDKYFVMLKDEKLTLGNLMREVLFRRDIKNSKLLHHNIKEEKEDKYLHRLWIFISFLCIYSLKYILPPVFKRAKKIEQHLNDNMTDETLPGYITILGHLDKRKVLDKGIKQDDGRYLPALSMMACKLAYENEPFIRQVVSSHWKMKFEGFYTLYNEFREAWETQAFIFRDTTQNKEKVIVAFRGTSAFIPQDWCTDFDLSWCKLGNMPGKLHRGFLTALGLRKTIKNLKDIENLEDCYHGHWPKDIDHQDPSYGCLAYYKIRDELRRILLENNKAKFIVTGHSLGGALAILFPTILALHEETDLLDRLEAVYTFGQPRVGNKKFVDYMGNKLREHNVKYYRIVYSCDAVPNVPWDMSAMRFKHFGTCINFNSLYQGKINNGRPSLGEKLVYVNKGLIGLMAWIMYVVNAVWELIRGFIIEITAGEDYRESWILIVLRIISIPAPCLIAHIPTDYVNATRLASPHLFLN